MVREVGTIWYILGRSFLQIINFVFLTQLFYFGHSAFCFARLGCPANQKTKNHNLMGVRKSVSFFYLLFARPLRLVQIFGEDFPVVFKKDLENIISQRMTQPQAPYYVK